MTSYQCRKSHCGDKTILRPSYLHNGISYTGKMTSLYWIRALILIKLEATETVKQNIIILVWINQNYNTCSTQKKLLWHKNIWFDTKKLGSTQKCMVQHKKAWFNTKMYGSTQKSSVRHKNAELSMHQLPLPLSNSLPHPLGNNFFPILFKHFVFKIPNKSEN